MDRTATAICGRVRALRQVTYGRRGRAKMARELGISPSTYNYYERDRIPPADVLARMAAVTGARLDWLVTGRGPQFDRPAEQSESGAASRSSGLLGRLERLLGTAPRLEQPVAAFVRMLEEMAGVRWADEAGPSAAVAEGLIPVMGGTAAGVARFWREYGPGGSGVTTLEDRVREVLDRSLVQGRRPAEVAPAAPVAESEAGATHEAAALVQVSEPDGAGVVEFIDCPYARSRARDVFGLRVDGDSMAPRYRDGDVVLLSPDEPAREHRPAVVKVRGQIGATCKLYVPRGERVHLVPINEAYPATEHPREAIEWALAVLWRVVVSGET